ncbi:hypothetical protein [Streptomyces malaysiensis]|uniref:Uncharacterized protein n=1 Tax=Streptomyces malaysiensis subsp. samsunensis TaxID=459658 RepID=A0A9X2LXT2_STRMQ|nr:hypothetical protein [Streptomyces samsunensis]MCQ8831783.1 hypothetical protein [Streptomyces samsunensis]
MPDYSNPDTPLTGRRCDWQATIVRGPVRYGMNPSQECAGTCTPRPGATVGSLLAWIKSWYAEHNGIPVSDVTIMRYSLREK